jgi:TPP-dependent pyruvate/acetoin dehydrogenase alpha subunit
LEIKASNLIEDFKDSKFVGNSFIDQAEKFRNQMLLIRLCEEKLLDLAGEGKIRGTVHTSIGQEACSVGVVNALDLDKDIICSNHRGHGHYLAYSWDIKGLLAEVLGLENGVCGGIGGSQHLQNKNFYTNGILGGMPPIAVGMALAEKFKKTGAISTVFFGDGAMGEGSVYEALNLAALWNAPILFILEQNQYAQSTAFQMQHSGNLKARPEAFGVKVVETDGNDVEDVFKKASEIISQIRQKPKPYLLFANTYRLGPHSKGDDFRDETELNEMWKREPIINLEQKFKMQTSNIDIKRIFSNYLDDMVESLTKQAGEKSI